MEREVHGGIQLSQIETERLLMYLVAEELKVRKAESKYKGAFSFILLFLRISKQMYLPLKIMRSIWLFGSLKHLKRINQLLRLSKGYCRPNWKMAFYLNSILVMCLWRHNQLLLIMSWIQNSNFSNTSVRISKNWYLKDHYENPGLIQFYSSMARRPTFTIDLSYECYVDQIEEIERLVEIISENVELICLIWQLLN
ncbi:unnamed protein product (macronuclear) [Paramecium tetraurelia]|uniref:Uncharacterized protein n=1 Tax=Paramecium tetraurelia TaxID=5888 RepID=A0BGI3_PARTE|nr:uncharacterized protein GSPATT00028685001 [Paramecium tetraurelia]CAK57650.1 unnamed protein product [Paramecium tetraurelia]|eukprot:XP_001425048.1 hypothetical protein (macronuclear) [Paramecium tetraurelia strain d4-2]